jgi:hypothetical protein
LIDYLKRVFSISSFIIKLLMAFIEGSLVIIIFIKLAIGSRNAIFRKISSFSLIIVTKSPLASFIAKVVKEALKKVYFSAVQHLFLSL